MLDLALNFQSVSNVASRMPGGARPNDPHLIAAAVSTKDALAVLSSPSSGWSLPAPAVMRLAELGRLDPANADLSAALTRLMVGGAELVPHVLGFSVTVRLHDETFTVAASNELVERLDDMQYLGHLGPCMTALSSRSWVHIPDLAGVADDGRWPLWREAALDAGVGSLISIPVGSPESMPASINVYAVSADVLEDPAALGMLTAIAAHATVLLANLDSYGRATQLAQQLTEAMESRARLEQAKGVLIAQLGVDAETAWAYLVKLSQAQHMKARDIAAVIVDRASNARPVQ